jgi:L-methionine (R)-S-oxide reductase
LQAQCNALSRGSRSDCRLGRNGGIDTLKSTVTRLGRESAKELLARIDSSAKRLSGREAREAVVEILNSGVPTYSWVGIYLLRGSTLQLDAWKGPAPTEHVSIPLGRGVCGFAAKAGRTEIVSDVSKDPRYLQCFLSTKSEIVVPIIHEGSVVGEIDIDSDQLDAFTTLDKEFLEAVAAKIARHCVPPSAA